MDKEKSFSYITIIITCMILIYVLYTLPIRNFLKERDRNIFPENIKETLNKLKKFAIWNEENYIDIEPLFEGYSFKLYRKIPKEIPKNSFVYFLENYIKYPMYFWTSEGDYFYPDEYSTIYTNKKLYWRGTRDIYAVIGIKK